MNSSRIAKAALVVLGQVFVVALVTTACGPLGLGPAGPPGSDGDDGTSVGTLTGKVTNAMTGSDMEGVAIVLDPALAGVGISTDASGAFTQELPIGVYTVTVSPENFEPVSASASILAGEETNIEFALTPTASVAIAVDMVGDTAPGETLSATASVSVQDGSTIQGYSWTQGGGVDVTLSDTDSDTVTVALPDASAFKDRLLHVLAEPPISQEHLPPNIELPEGEFPGGLQNRFYVLGLNPFTLEEAALINLNLTVTTSSGTYESEFEIHAQLPWKSTQGLHNVPVGVPVLLHGRNHVDEDADGVNDETGADTTYDWSLDRPGGSTATLIDSTSRAPYFTPDASGMYTVTVTDTTRAPGDEVVTMTIYAGTWQGAITGQDENGRPLAANCTGCHNNVVAPDMFTPWMQTGHAEIFTDNLNTSTHYSENCFSCHSVGYDPDVDNDGFDEAGDFQDFLDAGLLSNPGDNWTTVLAEFPDTAQLANIQCENCHGPQNGGAHFMGDPRVSLGADVCASCHGEPLRHARFQQWQLSGHANYELAESRSQSGSCSRCHTVNGFLAWLPILLDDDPATDPMADVEVAWTTDQAHPMTCVTCHDPHDIGTTTGVTTNATVRISGNTPPLIAGFEVFGAGRGAICMTCHNSRRGLQNDDLFPDIAGTSATVRAPHGSAQTDILMGQNAYFVDVGVRGAHSLVEDTCVNCHMTQTAPPELLSYDQGGTNHTFAASLDICMKCHGEAFSADGVQTAYQASADTLLELIEELMFSLVAEQLDAGNTVNFGGLAMVTDVDDIDSVAHGETHGQQALVVTLADGTVLDPVALGDIIVLDADAVELGAIYEFADDALLKATWNWTLAHNDGSRGVHNPSFVFNLIDRSIDELNDLLAE